MSRAAVAGAFALALAVGCSACSPTDDDKEPGPEASGSPAAECTEATATATVRAQISMSGIEPACVKVGKGGSFTLLNADTKAHSLTTTESSPVQLQVDLRKGAAFPYRFTKAGTYTLEDSRSDLVLTIVVT